MTYAHPALMLSEQIEAEINEISARTQRAMDEVSVCVVTACPSEVVWMSQEDRQRMHDLKMEFQARGPQRQQEARERILARRKARKLERQQQNNAI